MNKDIKMVLFDVDDTLIYTIDTAYKKTNIAGNRICKKNLRKEDFINLYGKYNFEECVKRWYNIKNIKKFVDEYNNIKLEYDYIGDIEKIIKNIKKLGIIIGIVTNSTKEKTEKKLKEYIKLFDFIYSDAEKPNKKAILEIMSKYNLKNEEIILIGDSENDYQVSQNANINFCGVNTGKRKWNNQNVKYIESINELLTENNELL